MNERADGKNTWGKKKGRGKQLLALKIDPML
jgi:hypothetical protein